MKLGLKGLKTAKIHFISEHFILFIFRSSHQGCSVRKGVLRNFAKFTGKHLRQSLFSNKVAGAACNFIKKETLAQMFSCEFCGISKKAFFTEHLWVTVSRWTVSKNNERSIINFCEGSEYGIGSGYITFTLQLAEYIFLFTCALQRNL